MIQLFFATSLVLRIVHVMAIFLLYLEIRMLLTPTVPYSPVAVFMAERNGVPCARNTVLLYCRLFPICFTPSTISDRASMFARGYQLHSFGCAIAPTAMSIVRMHFGSHHERVMCMCGCGRIL